MNLIEQINDIFIPNGDDVLKKETFSRFEISYSVSKNILEHLEVASVQRVLSFIEERDDYHLWIKCDVFDTALLLSRRKDIPVFISEIKRELNLKLIKQKEVLYQFMILSLLKIIGLK